MSHAIERARERYGVTLQWAELGAFARAIRASERTVVDLGRRPDGTRLMAIRHRRRWMAAVVQGCFIKTFLDPDKLDEFGPQLFARKRELRLIEYKGVSAP
jgi:hypothetical protein